MSSTDEPGARSSSEVAFEEDIWISDRMSPDFINDRKAVKLATLSTPDS